MSETKVVRASSERVVSSKVIGSSNPLARGFRRLTGSIAGISSGCVMLFIAIGLIIAAVKAVPDNSRKVEDLKLLTPEEAVAQKDGLVKVEGKPEVSAAATLTYKTKNEFGQEVPQTFDQGALYVKAEFQIYEQQKEVTTSTQTVTQDGKDVEQTSEKTETTEDWVTKNTTEKFAVFTMGGITIDTDGIDTRFDLKSSTIESVVLPEGDTPQVYENPTDQVGDTRLIIQYVVADEDFIVIGNIDDKEIHGGDVNMISDYSDSELISKLKGEESAMRWVIRIVAWLLLTAGFSSIVGPVLVLTNLIPGVNKIVGCVTFIVFGMLSAGIILLITFAVNYWWLVILCIVLFMALLGGLGIYLLTKKK